MSHLKSRLPQIGRECGSLKVCAGVFRYKILSQAVAYYTENEPKGECVIVIEGKSVQEIEAEDQARWHMFLRYSEGDSPFAF